MKKILSIFLIPILIFLTNAILVWPLFWGGYTQQIGSIESVFIADARFIKDNFPHLSWNPYWYAGFPFHLFYTPLLPFLMAMFNWLIPAISLASWYRILIGLFYATTPVSLYFLARFLTGKNLLGFLAALFYSFLPSIGYFLPSVGAMANTYGNAPWRLLTLILFGEGGHIFGLFFLPLALLFAIRAVREASWENMFWVSLVIGLLALSNIIALIGFGVMLGVALVVELMSGDWLKKLGRAGIVFLFSFGLVSFWYNLSFIKASFSIGTGGVGGSVGEAYLRSFPLIFLLFPVFFALVVLGKKKIFQPILIAFGWILIFYLSAYFWFHNQTMLLPQPNRYLPEMDMGVALLFSWLIYFLSKRKFFYILVILLILYLPFRYINQVWNLTSPHQEIAQTSEYRIASWLKENTPGERVYASGTSAFWLNTFADIPQIRGGNDGVANPWMLHAVYQINTGENAPKGKEGEVAVWWLRALNASFLVVNFPTSKEIYHDFRNPEKFAGVEGVEELVELNGDVIYKIPLSQPSLAQVVSKKNFTGLKPLKNAVDVPNLGRYVDYIDGEKTKKAEFFWVGVGRAKIKAEVGRDEGIGVQISYNPGWKAYIDRKPILIKNDIIGFIFLDPGKEGEVEVNLVYGRTWDVWLGYFLTILSLGGLLVYPRLSARAVKLFKKAEKKWEEE